MKRAWPTNNRWNKKIRHEEKKKKDSSRKAITVLLHSLAPPRFALQHDYDSAIKDIYHNLPGNPGHWDSENKYWHFPFSIYSELKNKLANIPSWEFHELPPLIRTKLMESRYLKNSLRDLENSIKFPSPQSSNSSDGISALSKMDSKQIDEPWLKKLPPELLSTLYKFQVDAVRFAERRLGRILIADEMGLGKTLEAIAITALYEEDWPLLVICPLSLCENWRNELLKWIPHLCQDGVTIVKDGSSELHTFSQSKKQAFICTYGLIPRLTENGLIAAGQFQVVCVDESHMIKSPTAQRTKCILPLLQKSRRSLCLTGTPVLSRPIEAFTTLSALMPEVFGEKDYIPFAERYCDAKQGPLGLDVSGASNSHELKMILESSIMIRRLKEQVLNDVLPVKIREAVLVSVDKTMKDDIATLLKQRCELGESLKDLSHSSDELAQIKTEHQILSTQIWKLTGLAKVNGVIFHLKRILNVPTHSPRKTNQANETKPNRYNVVVNLTDDSDNESLNKVTTKQEQTDDVLDEEPFSIGSNEIAPRKIVVFAHHHEVLDAIEKSLIDANVSMLRIDGGTPKAKRQLMVDRFQTESKIRMILLSITAASVGITLTKATMAIFAELYWTPGVMAQAEDRIHRIGQKSHCTVQYLLTESPSMDQCLLNTINFKQNILQKTTGISHDTSDFKKLTCKSQLLHSGQSTITNMFTAQNNKNNHVDHKEAISKVDDENDIMDKIDPDQPIEIEKIHLDKQLKKANHNFQNHDTADFKNLNFKSRHLHSGQLTLTSMFSVQNGKKDGVKVEKKGTYQPLSGTEYDCIKAIERSGYGEQSNETEDKYSTALKTDDFLRRTKKGEHNHLQAYVGDEKTDNVKSNCLQASETEWTDEQIKKIEQNRLQALEKLRQRNIRLGLIP